MERGQIHAVRMWQLAILTSWIWIFSELLGVFLHGLLGVKLSVLGQYLLLK